MPKFQLILESLKQHERDVNILETSITRSPSISDERETIMQLKRKLGNLIARSNSGITLITVSDINYLIDILFLSLCTTHKIKICKYKSPVYKIF